MNASLKERVSAWIASDPDPATRRELSELLSDGAEIELARRFAGRLAFGTAGLRGLLGGGPGRMNRLVVQQTTAGLGHYLLAQLPDAAVRGVVVGYDARRGSRQFAVDAASVLGGLGIAVHLFDREVPTPLVAFAVKEVAAAAGVMVTASHNPPEYNGYKVYWGDGAQIVPPHDHGIARAIDAAAAAPVQPWQEHDELRRQGLLHALGEATLERYLAAIATLSVHTSRAGREQLRIAYTPLHGVGAAVAERALTRAGFTDVHTVPSQRAPDGAFPTVRFPNPEEPGAMDAVLALAEEVGAELVCANDPDADRLCIGFRRSGGGYQILTGDQLGVLLAADRIQDAGPSAAVATTIVSSQLLPKMAAALGVHCDVTLTGFKWLAAAGKRQMAAGRRFVFAYEEALGYGVGDVVLDKDGISSLVCFAEMTAALRQRGQTVLDALEAIYRRYGLFVSHQQSVALDPNATGPRLGDKLRAAPPSHVAGLAVCSCTDLAHGRRLHADGRTETLDLPPSDVLIYQLEGGARVTVRPSGTEPKLKCYYEICMTMAADEVYDAAQRRADASLRQLVAAHQAELAAIA